MASSPGDGDDRGGGCGAAPAASDAILVLNGGSSSLKFALFGTGAELRPLARGSVSSVRHQPRLLAHFADDADAVDRSLGDDAIGMTNAFDAIAALLDEHALLPAVRVVGHRIVHGGRDFTQARELDAATLDVLRHLEPLAPIHQAINLEIVALAGRRLAHARQFGAFDTAFHASRPRLATLFGLPHALSEEGIVAYGFHGLSYSHIAAVLRERHGADAGGRAIVAHLGAGASLCAMQAGRSCATTMGFSTLDGLIMSTRCGAVDAGVLLHLLKSRGMSPEGLSRMLYEQSGLLGVSGISGDMRALLASGEAKAAEAIDLFVYRASREIGSMAAALGGLDTLVFTGGIGENAAGIRQRICQAAGWLGVEIDETSNAGGSGRISAAGSSVEVLVIPADEERAVAAELLALNA